MDKLKKENLSLNIDDDIQPEVDNIIQTDEDDTLLPPEFVDDMIDDNTPNPPIDEIPCDSPVSTDLLNQEPTVEEFFGTLQSSVTSIWTYHLKTNKHFIHVELDKLYHGLLEKVDNLIEVYQGIIGSVVPGEFVNTINTNDKDELIYIYKLVDYIRTSRSKLFGEELSEVMSILDDILNMLDSTIYKLTTFNEPPIKTFESFCYEKYKNPED